MLGLLLTTTTLYWKFFHRSGFLSNMRLPCKTEFALKYFTVLNIFFTFRILSNLRLPWKTELPGKFSLYWISIFYHSVLLSNLRLPWKTELPWIHCIENIFFIIQDFWATCACSEKQSCPENFHCISIFLSFRIFEQLALAVKTCLEFTVLNICFLSIRIFEQLALYLKRGCLEFTVLNLNIYFLSFSIFEQLALALKIFTVFKYFLSFRIFKQLALALNSLYWIYIFYHSVFLSNLRLSWKQSLPLNFSLYLNIFYHSVFLINLRLPWNSSLHWIYFFIIQYFWATSASSEKQSCLENFPCI